MRFLQINFSWQPWRLGRLIGLGLFVAAIMLLAFAGYLAWQMQQERTRWQSESQRLNRTENKRPASSDNLEQQKAELRLAGKVIAKLAMPWDELFGAIESAQNEQATLLGIEPDTERREVHLSVEAKDTNAMLAYVKQLRAAPVLKDAYLITHQVNAQDPQRPIRFTVLAHWADAPLATPPSAAATEKASAPSVAVSAKVSSLAAGGGKR